MSVKSIADQLFGDIPITILELSVLNTREFCRLHNIKQTSSADLTYPSLKVSRFEHSLGVMHLSGIMFRNAVTNATHDDKALFIKLISEEVEGLLKGQKDYIFDCSKIDFKNTIESIDFEAPDDSVFNLSSLNLSPVNAFSLSCYISFYQAVRLSGLLHDIGHLPFAHLFEYAIHNVSEGNQQLQNAKVNITGEKNIQLHEGLSLIYLDSIKERVIKRAMIDNDSKTYVFCLFVAVVFELVKKIFLEEDTENLRLYEALHEIIASPLDADRLDATSRVQGCSGISLMAPNLDRMLSRFVLRINIDGGSKKLHFVHSVKAINDIEKQLTDRFNVYKSIICHHKVLKTDSLIQKSIEFILNEGKDNNTSDPVCRLIHEFYTKTAGFLIKLSEKGLSVRALLADLYRFDEIWAVNIMREIMISCETISNQRGNLGGYLKEIFLHKKRYRPLWKKEYEYTYDLSKYIDENVKNHFTYQGEVMNPNELINSLRTKIDHRQIESNIQKSLFSDDLQISLEDIIVVVPPKNKLNSGIKDIENNKTFLLDKDGDLIPFGYISRIRDQLEGIADIYPLIHIFYKLRSGVSNDDVIQNKLRKTTAKSLCQLYNDKVIVAEGSDAKT